MKLPVLATGLAVSATAGAVGGMAIGSAPSEAHEYACQRHFAGSFELMKIDPSGTAGDAVRDSIAQYDADSAFDWDESTNTTASRYFWYSNSDRDNAGRTTWVYLDQSTSCSGSAETLDDAMMRFNQLHDFAGHGGANDYKCTAMHEMAHGVGYDHNSLSGSVLEEGHPGRCHVSSPTLVLGTHDISDIAGDY
jgi:hypothetical protein